MIKILIKNIAYLLGADERQISVAVFNAAAKGRLDEHELRQLESQRLPISRVFEDVTHRSIELAILDKAVSYEDLLCMLGIIAQECQVVKRAIWPNPRCRW